MRKLLSLIVASVLLVVALFALFAYTPSSSAPTIAVPYVSSGTYFDENITIYANGTVSDPLAIDHIGTAYTLNGSVNGTLSIYRNSTNLNGGGFNVNGMGRISVVLENVSNVMVSDLSLNNTSLGIIASYVSGLTLTNLNISAPSGPAAAFSNVSNAQLSGDNFSSSSSVSILVAYSSNVNLSSDNINNPTIDGVGLLISHDPTPVYLYKDSVNTTAGKGVETSGITTGIVITDSSFAAYQAISVPGSISMFTVTGSTFNLTDKTGSNGYVADFEGDYSYNTLFADNYVYSNYTNAIGVNVNAGIGNNVTVTGNIFSDIGIAVEGDGGFGSSFIISNNKFIDSKQAVQLYFISGVTITGNDFINSSDYGIEINPGVNNTITGNSFQNVSNSIILVSVSGNLIVSDNLINDSVTGISLIGVASGLVYGNHITNVLYPLNVSYSSDVQIFDDSFNNSSTGINALDVLNSAFYSNSISNVSGNLFNLEQSSQIQVYANTYSNAGGFLLNLSSDTGVQFFHNNFDNGTYVNVSLSNLFNVSWYSDLPVGGNYWSNYSHNGEGTNGIGPYPYNISSSSQDKYPLTSPWKSYTITFVESGLPTGTEWSVTFGSVTVTTTGEDITYTPVAAEHVSIAYSIGEVSGYTLSSSSGSVTVNGNSQTISVTYTQNQTQTPQLYSVNFTETGLPSGTSWSLYINGLKHTSNTTYMVVQLPPGTYYISVSTQSGYSSSAPVSITVSNSNLSENVNYTSISSPSSGNTPLLLGMLGIGAVVGLVVGIVGFMIYTGTGPFGRFKKVGGNKP